jgi:hypothetical protein
MNAAAGVAYVMIKGPERVAQAMQACRDGTANPTQQILVAGFVDALFK